MPLQLSLAGGAEPTVAPRPAFERLGLRGGSWIDVSREWLLGADTLLARLIEGVDWRQGRRRMWDRMVDDPRLSRWFLGGEPLPDPALDAVGAALEARYGVPLVGPAMNYYRDGSDSVAPHADRELRVLDDTIVAIVTLGARRPFLVKPKAGGRSTDLAPAGGDLLVMGGATQRDWTHAIPKVAHAGPRVSLSWRWSSAQAARPRGSRDGSRDG